MTNVLAQLTGISGDPSVSSSLHTHLALTVTDRSHGLALVPASVTPGVSGLAFPKTDSETRTWRQGIYLQRDPRKHREGVRVGDWEGEGCVWHPLGEWRGTSQSFP